MKYITTVDEEINQAIASEIQRQRNTLELIASENFVSTAVLEAQGSVLTNKYAEGYSGRRYYGGCHNVDTAEDLAIKRAKEIFAAEHVNVQPHSGTQANIAVYNTVLKPGDTIMGMDLSHGGHLTHGSPVNYSGYTYKVVPYGVNKETELIDYKELEKLAKECCPKLIVVGASAYSRFIDYERFRNIANTVDAKLLVDIAHPAGLIAATVHPSPIAHAEFVTTTTHKTLRGPRGGMIMCQKQFAKQIDKSIFPGTQGGPLMHTIAAKAVAFKEALGKDFKEYQKQVVLNAKTLAQSLQQKGFKIVSGGTDTHLFLINLTDKGITGKQAEESLDKACITTNKNTVPFETKSPFVTSGVRIGTPAITTRGMKEQQMQAIGNMIASVLLDIKNKDIQENVKKQVEELCKQFPLYTDLN